MNMLQNILDKFRFLRSSTSYAPGAWEWSIARFETADRLQKPPDYIVVFTGSSSITFWATLEQDMAPLPVINRGFGGSKLPQVTEYVDRIVLPYHPRAVVLYAGINDLAGLRAKTAQAVCTDFKTFVKIVHAVSEIPIYYIGITSIPAGWNLWPIAQETNELIKAFTIQNQRLHFIDLAEHLLTPEGLPDRTLYRSDGRHLNQKGYALWTAMIKPILLADLLSN
jgi:lysophospholipase L1-like esterase